MQNQIQTIDAVTAALQEIRDLPQKTWDPHDQTPQRLLAECNLAKLSLAELSLAKPSHDQPAEYD